MRRQISILSSLILAAVFTTLGSVTATTPHFYRDDPISREPES
jgi:hypothetical protein